MCGPRRRQENDTNKYFMTKWAETGGGGAGGGVGGGGAL